MFSIKLRMVLKFRTLCALSDGSNHQKAGEDALPARSVVYRFSYLLLLTSSLRHPKILIKEFSYFLMPCHQHGLRINLLV